MKVEIFGKDFCPFCDKAVALAEKVAPGYTYQKLDKDFTREELFEQFPTARTFPQIRVDGVAIGGFTEFQELVG